MSVWGFVRVCVCVFYMAVLRVCVRVFYMAVLRVCVRVFVFLSTVRISAHVQTPRLRGRIGYT